MNISTRHFLLISTSLLLSGCGQSGGLYLPGHGTGYYHEHSFSERPTTINSNLEKPAPSHSSTTSNNTNSLLPS